MNRRHIEVGAVCHVYNRGVEKRSIFTRERDYLRFIHGLFEFNDETPAINTLYYFDQESVPLKNIEVGLRYAGMDSRALLVEILAFVLMPNHFHLMLRQIREGGITEFMRKLGTGYTNYFNKKYERVGHLFQGKYKSATLVSEAHFVHLPYYIHSNPLDLFSTKTKKGEVSSKDAFEFLKSYRWSSFSDYIGKQNFPSVTQRDFLLHFFAGEMQYKKDFQGWLAEREENKKRLSGALFD